MSFNFVIQSLCNFDSELKGTAGLVVAWEQQQQQLAVAGDLAPRLIRLWDVQRETRIRDLPTGADSCVVTSLAPDTSGE